MRSRWALGWGSKDQVRDSDGHLGELTSFKYEIAMSSWMGLRIFKYDIPMDTWVGFKTFKYEIPIGSRCQPIAFDGFKHDTWSMNREIDYPQLENTLSPAWSAKNPVRFRY